MKYTPNNFYKHTGVVFNIRKSAPNRSPDYVSDSGSKYWHTRNGVYRDSCHWGRVSSCFWIIKEGRKFSVADSRTERCVGYASWKSFTNDVQSVSKQVTHFDLDLNRNRRKKLEPKVNKIIRNAVWSEWERISKLKVSFTVSLRMKDQAEKDITRKINLQYGLV